MKWVKCVQSVLDSECGGERDLTWEGLSLYIVGLHSDGNHAMVGCSFGVLRSCNNLPCSGNRT